MGQRESLAPNFSTFQGARCTPALAWVDAEKCMDLPGGLALNCGSWGYTENVREICMNARQARLELDNFSLVR